MFFVIQDERSESLDVSGVTSDLEPPQASSGGRISSSEGDRVDDGLLFL